jgi:autotransporter-associated beta strand protein
MMKNLQIIFLALLYRVPTYTFANIYDNFEYFIVKVLYGIFTFRNECCLNNWTRKIFSQTVVKILYIGIFLIFFIFPGKVSGKNEHPTSISSISGGSTYCVGSNVTLSIDITSSQTCSAGNKKADVTVNYYSNSTQLNSGGSLVKTESYTPSDNTSKYSSSYTFSATNTLYYYVVVEYTNTGCTDASSITTTLSEMALVTVNPASVGGTISGGTSPLCLGSSTGTMTLDGYSGTIVQWEYQINSGGWNNIGNGGNATLTHTPWSTGTWEYRVEVKSGTCDVDYSAIRSFIVDAVSVGGWIDGNSDPICSDASTSLMTLTGSTGDIVRWEKRMDNGSWSDIANTLTTYSEIPTSAGNWVYRALVKSGSCPEVYSTSFAITVNPILSISLGTNPIITVGMTSALLTYSGTTGSPNAYSIDFDATAETAGLGDVSKWGLSASPISIDVPWNITTGLYHGNLNVSKSWPVCNSVGYPIIITVNPSVSAPTAGNNGPICEGSTLDLTASNITGATYSWTGPNGFTSAEQNPRITNSTIAASGVYSVTATVGGSTSIAGTTNAVVNAIPTAPTVTLTQPTCSVSTGSITIASPTETGMTYSINGSDYTNTDGIFLGLIAGNYSVTAKNSGGCISTATVKTIDAQPTLPSAPTGNSAQSFCSGSSPTVAGLSASGTAIQWYANPSGGSALNSLTPLTNGTHYYASQTVNGCESTSRFDVTVNLTGGGIWLGTTSADWNTASNWCGGVPIASTDVVIPVGTPNQPDIGAMGGLCKTLILYCGATSGSSITGTGTLTLGGDITVYNKGTGTDGADISCKISLGASRTLTVDDDGTSAADLTISNVISGAFGITKAGAGTMVLSGLNIYTGATNITTGTLKLGVSSALTASGPLGTGVGGTTVSSGASLDLNGFSLTGTYTEALSLNGTGVGALGALKNSSPTTSTYIGVITFATAAKIVGEAGLIAITGIPATGVTAITLGGSVGGTISTVIEGARTLTKEGSGTWTLSGASTYTGATTITAGTLKLGVASERIANTSALTVTSPGIFDLAGFSETVGSLAGSGTVTSSLTGTLTLTAGGDNSNTSFSGIIQNGLATSVALTKSGSGTWTLSGANTYSGATSVSAGVLNIQNASALGTTTSGTAVNSGAALELQGGITVGAEALSLTGTGISSNGALRNISGDNTFGGTITLGGTTTIQSDAGTLTLNDITGGVSNRNLTIEGNGNGIINGNITTGTGSVTKKNSGTWTLSGANTYSGVTTISLGTLKLGGSGSGANSPLGTVAGATSITSGAVLDLNGFTLATAEPLTIRGTGNSSGGALTNSSATAANYSGLLSLGAASSIITNAGDINITNAGTITGTYGLTLGGSGIGSVSSIIGTSTGTLTKTGTGTWTLSGANTYTGATSISAGTLVLNGSLASGSSVTVASGATLAGTGTANGAVSVSGTISPKTSGTIGTLKTGNLTLGAGGKYNVDINTIPSGGTAGTSWDKLTAGVITNSATSGSNFTVSLNGPIASFVNGANYTWPIGTYTGTAPSAANIMVSASGLTNTFTGTFSIGFSGNNINLIYTAAATSPVISATGTLSAVNTTYGTASASPTSFSVSGINMTAGILVTPPTGFEVSQTGVAGTYATTQTVGSSGTIASTTIWVRLAATTNVGNYSGNVALTSSGAAQVNVATVLSAMAAKALTISGISISNKGYDGLTTTSISGTAAYSGLQNGEMFSVTGTPVANFASAAVGNGKLVTVTGYTAPSSNYTITQPTGLMANITAAVLTYTAYAVSKTYGDANPSFSGTITGFVGSDDQSNATAGTLVFSSAATATSGVGSYAITGSGLTANNGNYTFVQEANNTTALTINKANLTITAEPKSKCYDESIFSDGYTVIYNGFVNSETSLVLGGTLTFSGTAIAGILAGSYTIIPVGLTSSNYDITFQNGTLTIHPRPEIGSFN